MDTDDPMHIQWLYETALERAKEFNISGVTYSLTQGVVKNIIPAIASTNAIIAGIKSIELHFDYVYNILIFTLVLIILASCCNEAFKLITTSQPYLNNYMMYTGNEGLYTYTFEHQKKPDCPVCGNERVAMDISMEMTVEDFIEYLKEKQDM